MEGGFPGSAPSHRPVACAPPLLCLADVETTTQTGALAGLQKDITTHGHNVIRTQMARSSGMVSRGEEKDGGAAGMLSTAAAFTCR